MFFEKNSSFRRPVSVIKKSKNVHFLSVALIFHFKPTKAELGNAFLQFKKIKSDAKKNHENFVKYRNKSI